MASLRLVGLALGRRDVRRHRPAWIALAAAALFAASLFDDPGTLAWTLFWCALSVAALLPRAAGIGKPVADLRRRWRRRRGARADPRAMMAVPGLPSASGALFAAADPLISQALAAIALPATDAPPATTA